MEYQGDLFNPLQKTEVSRDVFRALVEFQPARNFLPSLCGLTVTQGACDILPSIQHFIRPALADLYIDYDAMYWVEEQRIYTDVHDSDLMLLISSLPQKSPALQSLIFDDEEITQKFDGALWETMKGLHHLRHLDLPLMRLPSSVVIHLAKLPRLEQLSTVVIERDDVRYFTTQNGGFSSLTGFSFDALELPIIAAVLDVMQCNFQSLKIKSRINSMDYRSCVDQLTRAFSLLQQHHRLSLRKLSYSLPHLLAVPGERNGDLEKTAFLPLFSLPLLQEVELRIPLGEDCIDESWILKAAQSWPLLTSLILDFQTSLEAHHPILTLQGLIPLLKFCPSLSYLNLLLDVKPVPEAQRAGVCNHHIHQIDVAPGSIIADAPDVYPSIRSMFSCLKGMRDDMCLYQSLTSEEHALHKRWTDVNDLLCSPSRK
jgi:hypothetical protein